MASSIGSTIASFGASYIPDLSDTANIQTALKYLYYGSTGAANTSNGIYGALYTLFSGSPTFAGDVTITGNLTVNGSTTTVNSTIVTLDDKNIELLSTGTATDALADGGGLTLKGTTDKTFNYVNSTTAWTSNQNIDIVSTGTAYKIAGTNVLTSTQVLGKTPGGTSAGDIATIDGSQKLTNKSLSDSTTYIVDATDNTKRINIDVNGTTNITGVLQTAFTTAKTIAFPDLAGTVALTSLAGGGTNGSLTASNGGIVWSDASQFQILAGTATANKILMSGSTATPSWSTPTYPNANATANTFIRSDGTNYVASTVTIPATLTTNQLMYASAPTAITGLATQNNGVLVTDGTGVPSISSTLPANLSLSTPTLTTPTADIINAASAGATTSSLYNNLTTGTMAIGSALTTGVINIATATGFTSATGGQSVINIATGANTANTKTINIGNAGTGGTSVINLGTSGAAGTQTVTLNGTTNIANTFQLGGTTVTTTAAKLNYLTNAGGTTGTNTSNIVFSASPTFSGTVSAPTINSDATANTALSISTVTQSAVGNNTGSITIQTGNQTQAVTTNVANSSGSINIDVGTAGLGGSKGVVNIGNTVASTINIGTTAGTSIAIGAASSNITFGTNPTLTSASGTLTLFNSGITTVNAFNAATALSIGNAVTGTSVSTGLVLGSTSTTATSWTNIATAANTTGTKNINIGTTTASGGTSSIIIGSNVSGSTTNTYINGANVYLNEPRTLAGAITAIFNPTIYGPGVTNSATTGSATGGNISILSGSANITNAGNSLGVSTSGNILVDAGAATNSGAGGTATGVVNIGTTNASAVTIGNTSLTTTTSLTSTATGTITIGGAITTGIVNIASGTAGAKTINIGTSTGTNIIAGNTKFNGLVSTNAAAPTIASATTIAPTTQIVFVSGTTAIATITAPAPISTTGGQITIIPTGLFTTTTAGNIALASTAVVNKALIMTYDSTTAKWYPSY